MSKPKLSVFQKIIFILIIVATLGIVVFGYTYAFSQNQILYWFANGSLVLLGTCIIIAILEYLFHNTNGD